jgi:hypothetical protein
MATVHTPYGPGRIIASETVRGHRQFKVAGEGFEVWLDEAKLGGYESHGIDLDAPHWEGHDLGDRLTGEAFGPPADDELDEYSDPRGQFDRNRMRTHDDYDGYGDDPHYARLAWAPLDDDNSTTLPYNPDPQHDAIGSANDDESSTLQPVHHIDADERLRSSDSLSFEEEGGGEEPGPNPDLFARSAGLSDKVIPMMNEYWVGQQLGQQGADAINRVTDKVGEQFDVGPGWGPLLHGAGLRREANPLLLALPALEALGVGAEAAGAGALGAEAAGGGMLGDAAGMAARGVGRGLMSGGGGEEGGEGYGDMIQASHRRAEKSLSELFPPSTWDEHDRSENMYAPDGSTWDEYDERHPREHEGSHRPAGLSDRYIDITASADYHTDPVAQFRHDPDAYINRIGHVMDEGLNPRFAEYMDLVEADGGIREAAWKDVRAKAMRLKREGHVHVKDLTPGRIMASVQGDHGTYDVAILKGATIGGFHGNAISNWHCACEWGKWAFRRKFTFVGRLCSHAYASYLTMQSAALKNEPRRPRRGPADTVIVKRPSRDQKLPTFTFAAGRRQADALQNGPERLTPEMIVNDTDDAQMFLDVTKDERTDTGPDDVMSEKDIVHFARLMAACERAERPYPRQLVAFLARYAAEADDTQADYRASDADDADAALGVLRADADRDQESDLGNMAERVHKIQDAVEEAHDNGADASQFVAMVRRIARPSVSDEVGGIKNFLDGLPQPRPTQMPAGGYAPNAEGLAKGLWHQVVGGGTEGDQGSGEGTQGGSGSSAAANSYAEADEARGTKGRGNQQHGPRGTINNPENGKGVDTGQAPSDEALRRGVNPNTPMTPLSDNAPSYNGVGNGRQQTQTVNQNGVAGSGAAGAGAAGAAATPGGAPAGGGKYTAPGGGQTSGTIADGGVAGAENGNNAAITKTSPNVDADGMYTVGAGDTWSDIAQRTTGDMNNYQKMYDLNKGGAGNNIDDLAVGTKVNLKDFLNDAGNNNTPGNVTNPAGGGSDNNNATAEPVNTDAAAGKAPTPDPPAGAAETGAVPPVSAPPPPTAEAAPPTPAAPPNGGKPAGSLNAKAWMRWAADGDGSGGDSTSGSDTAAPEKPADTPSAAPAAPAAGTGTVTGPSLSGDTYSTTPSQASPAATRSSKPGMGGGSMGDNISNIGNEIGGAVSNFLPGIGGAISGISSGIGGLMNTFTNTGGPGAGVGGLGAGMGSLGNGRQTSASLFSSRQDFDDWVRYAYPTGAGDDDDPKTLPHLPFAGSGNPGRLEFGTSEEYADTARRKHDDVTDLDYDVHADLGDLQKQGSYDGYDDNSDIVRTFQAHLGGGGFESPSGGGRFDDFSGAAAGFLRTAGRNYSLAEQDELIREGDKGGARNLASLQLEGTHYEDMTTLGW